LNAGISKQTKNVATRFEINRIHLTDILHKLRRTVSTAQPTFNEPVQYSTIGLAECGFS
jgi:hypothetical protein